MLISDRYMLKNCLSGEHITLPNRTLGQLFDIKPGCFVTKYKTCMSCIQPLLELKNQPRFLLPLKFYMSQCYFFCLVNARFVITLFCQHFILATRYVVNMVFCRLHTNGSCPAHKKSKNTKFIFTAGFPGQ